MNKFKRIANVEDQVHFPNIDDWNESFWKHDYLILVTAQGVIFAVNADNEQDAIDYIIDYCEEYLPGLIMDEEQMNDLINDKLERMQKEMTIEEFKEREDEKYEYLDEYICGGNHSKYLNTHNVHIEIL